jgi:hypothetical protein
LADLTKIFRWIKVLNEREDITLFIAEWIPPAAALVSDDEDLPVAAVFQAILCAFLAVSLLYMPFAAAQ